MSAYTCQFTGESIDARLYDAIDFGDLYFNTVTFSFEDNCLLVTNSNNATATFTNWLEGNIEQLIFRYETYSVLKAEVDKATTVPNETVKYAVFGTEANDIITLDRTDTYFSALLILSGAGNDKVTATQGCANIINTGLGNDVVRNITDDYATITTGDGADVVVNISSNNATITTGDGADTVIDIAGSKSTIVAGKGDDVVRTYNAADATIKDNIGNDIITLYGGTTATISGGVGNDTYKIMSRLTDETNIIIDQTNALEQDRDCLVLAKVSKDEVKYSVIGGVLTIQSTENAGYIKIEGWENQALNKIVYKDGVVTLNDIDGSISQLEVIQSFVHALDVSGKHGFDLIDEAVSKCSNGLFNSLSELISSYKSDVLAYSGNTLEKRKEFLLDYCGINLDNEDTGAITGSDAGGGIAKTAESIVAEPASLSVADFTYNPETVNKINASYFDITQYTTSSCIGNTFSGLDTTKEMFAANVNGITFYWDENGWENLGIETTTLRQIIGGVINGWAEGALNLVTKSYGLSMDDENSNLYTLDDGTKGIQICLINDPSSTALAEIGSIIYYGAYLTCVNACLVINTAYAYDAINNINGNASDGQEYLDRTIAHEMVHANMCANVEYFGSLPMFISEGLAELVHGVDDSREYEILALTNTDYGTATYGLSNLIDDVFDQSTLKADCGSYTYGGGYLLLRYLAKQVSEHTSRQDISYTSGSLDTEGNLHISSDGTYYTQNVNGKILFEGSDWNVTLSQWTETKNLDFSAYQKAGMHTALHFVFNSYERLIEVLDVSDANNYQVLGTIKFSNTSDKEYGNFYIDTLQKYAYTTRTYDSIYIGHAAHIPNVHDIIAITGSMQLQLDRDNQKVYNYKNTDDTYSVESNYNTLIDKNTLNGEDTPGGDDNYLVNGYENTISDYGGGNDNYIINGDGTTISDYGGGKDSFTFDWNALGVAENETYYGYDAIVLALGSGDGIHANDTLTLKNADYKALSFQYYSGTSEGNYLLIDDDKHNKGLQILDWDNSEFGTFVFENASGTTKLSYNEFAKLIEIQNLEQDLTTVNEANIEVDAMQASESQNTLPLINTAALSFDTGSADFTTMADVTTETKHNLVVAGSK